MFKTKVMGKKLEKGTKCISYITWENEYLVPVFTFSNHFECEHTFVYVAF